jgi:predicted small secreted protein
VKLRDLPFSSRFGSAIRGPLSNREGIELTIKHVTAGLIVLAALALSACNTIRGMGQDVQSVGKTVEKTAN